MYSYFQGTPSMAASINDCNEEFYKAHLSPQKFLV